MGDGWQLLYNLRCILHSIARDPLTEALVAVEFNMCAIECSCVKDFYW